MISNLKFSVILGFCDAVCVSSGFEAEQLFPQSCLQHLLPCDSSVPSHHHGVSIEINSRVPTAIISHMVALIFVDIHKLLL